MLKLKREYSLKDAQKIFDIQRNYNALVLKWYEQKAYEILNDSEKKFIFGEAIKDIKKYKQEMKKYPEFFEKNRLKRLDKISTDLEMQLENA